jgi:hypothetical protein
MYWGCALLRFFNDMALFIKKKNDSLGLPMFLLSRR